MLFNPIQVTVGGEEVVGVKPVPPAKFLHCKTGESLCSPIS